MSEFKTLIAKVHKAAEEVVGKIQALDEQIAALEKERRAIESAPVSRADFMEYVREDIRRRGAGMPTVLKSKWARDGKFNDFVMLERYHSNGDLQPIPYLNGEVPTPGVVFDSRAFYWYFGELLADRFEKAVEGLEWPEDAMPVAERRKRIEEIDAKLEDLVSQRDELAADLQGVGMG